MVPSSTPVVIAACWPARPAGVDGDPFGQRQAASTTVPSGTTSLIRPQRSASGGADRLPVNSSSHGDLPRQLLDDAEHPAGGGDQAALDLGQAELGALAATTRSLARASSVPPPNAVAVDRRDGRLSMKKWLT